MQRVLDFGELSCLRLVCYYCGEPGHIAIMCPKACEFMPSFNVYYKYELSTSSSCERNLV